MKAVTVKEEETKSRKWSTLAELQIGDVVPEGVYHVHVPVMSAANADFRLLLRRPSGSQVVVGEEHADGEVHEDLEAETELDGYDAVVLQWRVGHQDKAHVNMAEVAIDPLFDESEVTTPGLVNKERVVASIRDSINKILFPEPIDLKKEYGSTISVFKNTEENRRRLSEAVAMSLKDLVGDQIDDIEVDVYVDGEGRVGATLSGPKELMKSLGARFPFFKFGDGYRFMSAVSDAIESDHHFAVKAFRRHLATNSSREEEVRLIVRCDRDDEGRQRFGIVDGGVTGHEHVFVDDRFVEAASSVGWTACAGTTGRWDALHISADQMRSAFEHFGIGSS